MSGSAIAALRSKEAIYHAIDVIRIDIAGAIISEPQLTSEADEPSYGPPDVMLIHLTASIFSLWPTITLSGPEQDNESQHN